MSTAFERIMSVQVPRWAGEFDTKSKDYNSATTGWEPHTFLGVKGQFADVWRKIHKLKKALWDEETLTGEQAEEIIRDLISHLFLTLDLIDTALPEDVSESEASAVVRQHLEIRDDPNIPPGMGVTGMAVMVKPKDGYWEGPRRLGITPDRWDEVKELADAVHNTGKPEILESEGYFLQVDSAPAMPCCNGCRWERTLETGTQEFHTYQGTCKYRIRRRKP